MGKLMQKTAKYQKRILNLLIAYGSYFEITHAVKKLVEKVIKLGKVEITPKQIEKNLMVTTPLDLIIRTGGHQRLSNFLLWQIAYTELWVTPRFWPEFQIADLHQAILDFSRRERRFGKVTQKVPLPQAI